MSGKGQGSALKAALEKWKKDQARNQAFQTQAADDFAKVSLITEDSSFYTKLPTKRQQLTHEGNRRKRGNPTKRQLLPSAARRRPLRRLEAKPLPT